MSKEKKKYTVTIFGDQYVLLSDEESKHVMHVTSLVDSIMREITEKSKLSDTKKIAVLTSLQLADRCLSLEAKIEKQSNNYESLARKIDEECLAISSR